ncbi:MAG TPA: aldehyde:ferredoxin oxidoreductase, partial [Desulfurococcales archaeon]|nr:aldehyde:ferredoxin oxidoreductase [Desulfurococcales archaeon]
YDYEPIYALGSMLGIGDPNGLLKLMDVVEMYGLDAMSTGVILAWITEALEKGIISEKETIVKLEWGDYQKYIKAVEFIVKQPNEFYKYAALGLDSLAEKYGGQDFALSYGGNPMPGYHTGPAAHIGYLIGARHSHLDTAGYSLDQKLLGKKYPTPEELVDKLVEEECWRQILSSLVVCFFARGIYKPDIVVKALQPLGYTYNVDDLKKLGTEIYREKYRLKVREGFKISKLRIPKRLLETPTPHGLVSEEYVVKALEYFKKKMNIPE